MRVVFFSFVPLTFWGGAEKFVVETSNHLHSRGHQVDIVTPSAWFSHLAYLSVTGRRCPQRLSLTEVSNRLAGPSLHWAGLNEMCLSLVKDTPLKGLFNRADVVYGKNEVFDLLFLRLLGRAMKVPRLVCGFHTTLEYPFGKSLKASVHNRVYSSLLYRKLLRSCCAVHVLNSHDEKALVEDHKMEPGKVFLIANGVDTQKFAPAGVGKLNVGFKVLFAGRLTEQKGVDVLEDAISILAETHEFDDIEFGIAGTGDLEDIAVRLAKERRHVSYLGHVRDMVALYNSYDVVVVPSRWEGSPFACIEPQSCGVPVIATEIPGSADIVVHGVTGLLTTPNDSMALSKAVLQLREMKANRPEAFLGMKEKARERALELYSLTAVARKLEDTLKVVSRQGWSEP